MTATKRVTVSAVSVGTTEKVFNYDSATSDCMPKKPEHAATVKNKITKKGSKSSAKELPRLPETSWTLTSEDDLRRFLEYSNNPDDITPNGAKLFERGRKLAKEIPLEKL
jgi:hypothetical protein